jgi:hypothetical protein
MNQETATNSGLALETGKIDFPAGFSESQKKAMAAMAGGLTGISMSIIRACKLLARLETAEAELALPVESTPKPG